MPPEGFHVQLPVFTGPFDLLLSLITRHRLDITEVALAQVTDEFISYLTAMEEFDLSQASEFLVVAATLLDVKAARLLPRTEVDQEDLELLEARDLLFARLLAYKAFREVADGLAQRFATQSRVFARQVPLEPHFAALLPELVMTAGPEQLAALAARALTRTETELVPLEHLHAPAVSVPAEGRVVVAALRRSGTLTFRALVADAPSTGHVVARFLALLDLFKRGAVAFDQVEALGELTIRWTAGTEDVHVHDDYDDDAPAGTIPAGTGSEEVHA